MEIIQDKEQWSIKMLGEYKNEFGLFIPDPVIKFNTQFVALLVSRTQNQPNNILIWKRVYEEEPILFTAYKYPKNKPYYIQDFSLTMENNVPLLYILSYKVNQEINASSTQFIYEKMHIA